MATTNNPVRHGRFRPARATPPSHAGDHLDVFSGRDRPENASPSARLVLYGQGFFLAMMFTCWLLKPSVHAIRIGLSYYGTKLETAGPFAIGFVGCAILTGLAIARFRSRSPWTPRLRRCVMTVLVLMLGVPMTPYSVDALFDWLHIGVCVVLFVAALVVGAWIAFVVLRSSVARLFVLCQTIGGLVAGATQLGLIGWMIPGQLLFELAFAMLVTAALKSVRSMPTQGLMTVGQRPQRRP